ncbi:hypothetical protein BRARA_H01216 [Brassica rapa]|uniref:RING-type domain-containing protein n=1 Tax=Brassica campestris TaxID=3711 RepID=A0A397YHK3_BRACM|nr:hypothetical protein BRARA_H01216 [Brassica rapa]
MQANELGKKSCGFLVEVQVEAVKETYFNEFVDLNDYDSEGRRILTNPNFPICQQEFGQSRSDIIAELRYCDHCFHRDCIFTCLGRKPTCPT